MSEIQHRKKDKNQHIQVFVRVRPANKDEICGKSSTVVEVPSPREVLVREKPHDSKLSKKFTFDRVFEPTSKQLDVYNAVVSPLLDEVLAGYNCTVFAYGQTGTGKTFTMEGVCNDPSVHWQSDTTAGIIPRSLNHLFDELRTLGAQEYTVKVSFLELYNEELFDLLSSNDDASKIRIYEDTTKKGAVIIHGLEEVTVHNKNEVYKILEKGSEKRQTAATLMNAQSSRSHTVFSVTIHIKENTIEGEELLKTGKLNLVDLAGSENVGRSGAVDRRAREAGNINQSLLTLGRVITALVERAPHIPYRESKLTRLLQESLGGRTKTSIIATISPAAMNLEETLSTLDYAYRAKNITNRPEINQKLSKKALLKEYTEEIERLRRDLQATRERNGVFLAQDNYNELQTTIEFQGKEIEEKINHIKALEEVMFNKEKLLDELKMNLEQSQYQIKLTEQEKNEQKYLVEKHVITEKKLLKQANELLNIVEIATEDTSKLHEKIDRKTKVEKENEYLGNKFRENISMQFDNISDQLSDYTQKLVQFSLSTKDEINELSSINSGGIETAVKLISGQLLSNEQDIVRTVKNDICSNTKHYGDLLDEIISSCLEISSDQSEKQASMYSTLAVEIEKLVKSEISKNLQKINEDHEKKINQLDKLSDYMKNTIHAVCNKLLEDRERLNEQINLYTDRINEVISAQESLSKREKNLFKIFTNFQDEYTAIYNEKKMVCETSTSVAEEGLEFCKSVALQMEESCSTQTQIKSIIDQDFSNTIVSVKDQLNADVQANLRISESSIQQIKAINDNLIENINQNEKQLKTFNADTTSRISRMRSKINNDMECVVKNIEKIDKLVSDISVNHEHFLEDHRRKVDFTSQNICQRLENQSVQSTDWNNKITSNVRTTQHQFDKFIVEDMRRDTPTGSTPAKRQFNYPTIQQLATTSPHERIIQRFRKMKNEDGIMPPDGGEGDDSLLSADDQFKTSSTPPNDQIHCDNSNLYSTIPDTLTLTKSASISDLSSITRDLTKEMIRSISDVSCKGDNNNKENGIDQFLKPVEFKSTKISKLKNPTRRILSSQNS